MALKTDYQNDELDTSVNEERTYNIVDANGNVLYTGVRLRETTVLLQEGSGFGKNDVNAITKALTDETANVSFQFGIDGNGDYGYIKEGETAVTPFQTRHTETYKPTSRANNLDMGLYHKKRYVDTTSVPNTNSGTYKPTQRKNNNDMGATNTYRYVDTTSVPNTNSQTYSVTSNGTKDMGETNIYRYVSVAVPQNIAYGLVSYNRMGAGTVSLPAGYKHFLVIAGSSNTSQGGGKITWSSPLQGAVIYNENTNNLGGTFCGVLYSNGQASTVTIGAAEGYVRFVAIVGINISY